MIVKQKNGMYKVVSHSGKNLGKDLSKKQAHKRLGQVEYFKRQGLNSSKRR